jgi:hypothetical protein
LLTLPIFSYTNSDLVFAPQNTWKINGTAKFGQRALILALDTKQRIDFRYPGTLAITIEDGALIVSMQEPPHFYDMIIDPLTQLMAGLGINGRAQTTPTRLGPDRHRRSFLDEDHKLIVGNCLIYRIDLMKNNQASDNDRMQLLRKARGLPPIVPRHTTIVSWLEPYAIGLRRLQNTLSGANIELPFVVTFQIQKLVQNNYLMPALVADLIPAIKEMTKRSEIPVCVGAIKKLFPAIPYPAPDVEATDFQLDTLIESLKHNEELCKRDGPSLEEARRSDNVAIIHRAKVTPTHVFLYGPEPETTNRVLRKYADHHDYFLRVQFCDEDGMPVRFNPRISNERIYHGRFKDVLLNGIKIADRKYDYLGFSHSSLRAQTCWFVAPFVHDGGLIWDRMIIRE